MRVFAGPNGSGKSTIIDQVRQLKVDGKKVDFGIYINADDIAKDLVNNTFNFDAYKVTTTAKEFKGVAVASGLIGKRFNQDQFEAAFALTKNTLKLKDKKFADQLAQIVADFLRKKLIEMKVKFSFETVFSHQSKLDIMRKAKEEGYKVYLYFVTTNSPDLNKERVLLRVKKGGHPVPPELIESRYYRTMEFLFGAAQLTYQTYFWDNSQEKPRLFTHFKVVNGKKKWKKIQAKDAPDWFFTYYVNKVKQNQKKIK